MSNVEDFTALAICFHTIYKVVNLKQTFEPHRSNMELMDSVGSATAYPILFVDSSHDEARSPGYQMEAAGYLGRFVCGVLPSGSLFTTDQSVYAWTRSRLSYG